MARREIIACDVCEKEPAFPVKFGHRGTTYEIDVCEKDAVALEKALAPYLDKARKAFTAPPRSTPAGPARKTTADKERIADIRAWANSNGYNVADRGRIKAEIVEAYDNAHA